MSDVQVVAAAPCPPGWRVVRVLDARTGWVVCQTVVCWLTIRGGDALVVVPGVMNGEAVWPAHRDDLMERVSVQVLEPGEHITVADFDELVAEQRFAESLRSAAGQRTEAKAADYFGGQP